MVAFVTYRPVTVEIAVGNSDESGSISYIRTAYDYFPGTDHGNTVTSTFSFKHTPDGSTSEYAIGETHTRAGETCSLKTVTNTYDPAPWQAQVTFTQEDVEIHCSPYTMSWYWSASGKTTQAYLAGNFNGSFNSEARVRGDLAFNRFPTGDSETEVPLITHTSQSGTYLQGRWYQTTAEGSYSNGPGKNNPNFFNDRITTTNGTSTGTQNTTYLTEGTTTTVTFSRFVSSTSSRSSAFVSVYTTRTTSQTSVTSTSNNSTTQTQTTTVSVKTTGITNITTNGTVVSFRPSMSGTSMRSTRVSKGGFSGGIYEVWQDAYSSAGWVADVIYVDTKGFSFIEVTNPAGLSEAVYFNDNLTSMYECVTNYSIQTATRITRSIPIRSRSFQYGEGDSSFSYFEIEAPEPTHSFYRAYGIDQDFLHIKSAIETGVDRNHFPWVTGSINTEYWYDIPLLYELPDLTFYTSTSYEGETETHEPPPTSADLGGVTEFYGNGTTTRIGAQESYTTERTANTKGYTLVDTFYRGVFSAHLPNLQYIIPEGLQAVGNPNLDITTRFESNFIVLTLNNAEVTLNEIGYSPKKMHGQEVPLLFSTFSGFGKPTISYEDWVDYDTNPESWTTIQVSRSAEKISSSWSWMQGTSITSSSGEGTISRSISLATGAKFANPTCYGGALFPHETFTSFARWGAVLATTYDGSTSGTTSTIYSPSAFTSKTTKANNLITINTFPPMALGYGISFTESSVAF